MLQPQADVARQLSCRGLSDSGRNLRIPTQFSLGLLQLHVRFVVAAELRDILVSDEFHSADNESE